MQTDLQQIITMLAKTTHDYTKRTITMNNGDRPIIVTLANGIEFQFYGDGSIDFISKTSK